MEKHQNTNRETDKEQSRTFCILLVITGVGVMAAVFVPKEEKAGAPGQNESLQTSTQPVDKQDESQQMDVSGQETEKEPQQDKQDSEDVRAAVVEQADLLAAGYDYDSAIETV